jgi:hypothetical protein
MILRKVLTSGPGLPGSRGLVYLTEIRYDPGVT